MPAGALPFPIGYPGVNNHALTTAKMTPTSRQVFVCGCGIPPPSELRVDVYGARSKTLTWLGAIRQPGQLVEFCSDMLLIFVAGIPPMSTVNEPVR